MANISAPDTSTQKNQNSLKREFSEDTAADAEQKRLKTEKDKTDDKVKEEETKADIQTLDNTEKDVKKLVERMQETYKLIADFAMIDKEAVRIKAWYEMATKALGEALEQNCKIKTPKLLGKVLKDSGTVTGLLDYYFLLGAWCYHARDDGIRRMGVGIVKLSVFLRSQVRLMKLVSACDTCKDKMDL